MKKMLSNRWLNTLLWGLVCLLPVTAYGQNFQYRWDGTATVQVGNQRLQLPVSFLISTDRIPGDANPLHIMVAVGQRQPGASLLVSTLRFATTSGSVNLNYMTVTALGNNTYKAVLNNRRFGEAAGINTFVTPCISQYYVPPVYQPIAQSTCQALGGTELFLFNVGATVTFRLSSNGAVLDGEIRGSGNLAAGSIFPLPNIPYVATFQARRR
jgi:hypothetical protein